MRRRVAARIPALVVAVVLLSCTNGNIFSPFAASGAEEGSLEEARLLLAEANRLANDADESNDAEADDLFDQAVDAYETYIRANPESSIARKEVVKAYLDRNGVVGSVFAFGLADEDADHETAFRDLYRALFRDLRRMIAHLSAIAEGRCDGEIPYCDLEVNMSLMIFYTLDVFSGVLDHDRDGEIGESQDLLVVTNYSPAELGVYFNTNNPQARAVSQMMDAQGGGTNAPSGMFGVTNFEAASVDQILGVAEDVTNAVRAAQRIMSVLSNATGRVDNVVRCANNILACASLVTGSTLFYSWTMELQVAKADLDATVAELQTTMGGIQGAFDGTVTQVIQLNNWILQTANFIVSNVAGFSNVDQVLALSMTNADFLASFTNISETNLQQLLESLPASFSNLDISSLESLGDIFSIFGGGS